MPILDLRSRTLFFGALLSSSTTGVTVSLALVAGRRLTPVAVPHIRSCSLRPLRLLSLSPSHSSLEPRTRAYRLSPRMPPDGKIRGEPATPLSPKSPKKSLLRRGVELSAKAGEKSTSGDGDAEGATSLLSGWASHQDASYHDLSESEAGAVRSALLRWYRPNRRKLPWRGDPPPYDGSTAGTATSAGGRKRRAADSGRARDKAGVRGGKKQRSVKDFFASPEGAEAFDSTAEEDEGDKGAARETPEALPLTAYGVWVSEIMLQQTRVEAVIPFYLKWMKSFPTVQDLAQASEEEVNAHWAGLGFYRRARMLHSGAKMVVTDFAGIVPSTVDELLTIPGVGPYTASAVASIAFGVCVPVVDGNVCRVLSRLRGIAQHIKAPTFKDGGGWRIAGQIVKAGNGKHAGEVNQALMELGATLCSPSGTGTDEGDPLGRFYLSTRLGKAAATAGVGSDPSVLDTLFAKTGRARSHGKGCVLCDADGVASVLSQIRDGLSQSDQATPDAAAVIGHGAFPIPPPKKTKREEVLALAALCRRTRRAVGKKSVDWLMVRRPADGLLAGQWEFPNVCVWNSIDKKANKAAKKKKTGGEVTVPIVDAKVRSSALDSFLSNISLTDTTLSGETVSSLKEFVCSRENLGSTPIEHVFSHVRHTMWVELGEIMDHDIYDKGRDGTVLTWTTSDGREVRWMTEGDMNEVGITSGVKKILKSVKKVQERQVLSARRKRSS